MKKSVLRFIEVETLTVWSVLLKD